MLTNEEICSLIEVSFPPYRCVAEIWDYGQKLRFRILDDTERPIVTMPEVVLSSIRDLSALEFLCEAVRQRLQEHVDCKNNCHEAK